MPEKQHNSMQKVLCYSFSNKETQEKIDYWQKVGFKVFYFPPRKMLFWFSLHRKNEKGFTVSLLSSFTF